MITNRLVTLTILLLTLCFALPTFATEIEPSLIQKQESEGHLSVIVYIQNPGTGDLVRSIKQRHKADIDAVSREIRRIERKYKPRGSLKRGEEREAVRRMRQQITQEDATRLRELKRDHNKKMDRKRREIHQALKDHTRTNRETVSNFITQNGGTVTGTTVATIGATIPSGFLNQLAEHPLVMAVTEDRPGELELDVSIPSVGYNEWWDNGLMGEGYDFGIVDTGVQEDHPAFAGITFYTNSGTNIDDHGHGTAVTGVATSRDSTFKGGAPGVESIIWSTYTSSFSVFQAMEWQASNTDANPEAINLSVGFGTATVDYPLNSTFYDAFIHNYNIIVTKSAGNGGWSDTDPTITHPATAYNLLSVANMDDKATLDRSDDTKRSSSSVGPTRYGRKKPDITAPGSSIISLNNDWATANDFVIMSGTSLSAPHVAGALVLLQQGGNHDAKAQKAVLINTADAWTSNNTSTSDDDGPVDGSHWDKAFGWGYLNMYKAYHNRDDYFLGSVIPNNDNSTPDDYKLYKGFMFAHDKATLVWHKIADYSPATYPSNHRALTDLDLFLFNEDDNTGHDFDNGSDDNVHQVATNTDANVVIKVFAVDSIFDNLTSDSFALATEENFIEAVPPTFTYFLDMPSTVYDRTEFNITANVTNIGDVAAHDNTVYLNLPEGFELISGDNPQSIGVIAAYQTRQATWTVKSPGISRSFDFTVSSSSNSYEETYTGGSAPESIFVECTVTLAWDPNTEDDLAGYVVYYGTTGRGGQGDFVYDHEIDIGNPDPAPSPDTGELAIMYEITGLDADTRYYFAVKAYDDADPRNISGYSENEPNGVICSSDVDPPTVPTNLVANFDLDHVDLSWDASTDDIGVEGYEIRRNSVVIDTTTNTAYTDSNIVLGQLCYDVRAYDAAGHYSGYSDPACVDAIILPPTDLIVSTTEQPPEPQNLIAFYDFEEGSGTVVHDTSGYGDAMDLNLVHGSLNWIADGVEVTTSSRLVSSDIATKIIDAITASEEATIEIWVEPGNTTQGGPARIVSLSNGTSNRNFTMGQQGSTYDQRFRTTTTDSNGTPSTRSGSGTLTTNLTHVAYTYKDGTGRIYINGVQNDTRTIGGDLSNWSQYKLHIFNESGNNRPWLGKLYMVAIYDRALDATEIQDSFNAGVR